MPALLKRFTQRGMGLGLLAVLGGCAIATPFQTTKTGLAQCKGLAFVSVTEAIVKPDASARNIFWRNVRAIEKSLPMQGGLVGYSVRQEPLGDTAWTMTLWADEASLIAFVYGGLHQTAINEASGATAGMRFARFTRACELGPPSWDEALAKLTQSGRSY